MKNEVSIESLEAGNLGAELEKVRKISVVVPNFNECVLDKAPAAFGFGTPRPYSLDSQQRPQKGATRVCSRRAEAVRTVAGFSLVAPLAQTDLFNRQHRQVGKQTDVARNFGQLLMSARINHNFA